MKCNFKLVRRTCQPMKHITSCTSAASTHHGHDTCPMLIVSLGVFSIGRPTDAYKRSRPLAPSLLCWFIEYCGHPYWMVCMVVLGTVIGCSPTTHSNHHCWLRPLLCNYVHNIFIRRVFSNSVRELHAMNSRKYRIPNMFFFTYRDNKLIWLIN